MSDPNSKHLPLTLMHLSFLIVGAGTLLLGPTLPFFAQLWHLSDAQSGLLIAAQFLGLFSGAIAVGRNLHRTLLCGDLIAAVAFTTLAFLSRQVGAYHFGVGTFYLLGFGLGQTTTTVNLLSALRYQAPLQRSSLLSLLNFTWSAGAVLSPLIAGFFLARGGVFWLLLLFSASAFALLVMTGASQPRTTSFAEVEPRNTATIAVGTAFAPLLFYCAIFFLYGGLEASLSGWLSTYTLRYTTLSFAAAAYCSTALWAAFAVGRALAAALLRAFPEKLVRSGGILLTALATIALQGAHTGLAIGLCATLIGLGIAPFFPVTFSLLVSLRPSSRQAGAASANIGLGAATIAYLTGLLSTHLGSLRTAMATPVAIAFFLLLLCSVSVAAPPQET